MVQINPQIKQVKESATLAINNRVKYLRSIGKEIYHFGFGQACFDVPELIQKSLALYGFRGLNKILYNCPY